MSENKAMVRRLVEAINAGKEDTAVEELFAPRAARRVTQLFAGFRSAFPNWHEEVVKLVAEGDTVAGRFLCSGTHLGKFLGEVPTGKRMEVEEAFDSVIDKTEDSDDEGAKIHELRPPSLRLAWAPLSVRRSRSSFNRSEKLAHGVS